MNIQRRQPRLAVRMVAYPMAACIVTMQRLTWLAVWLYAAYIVTEHVIIHRTKGNERNT